MSYIYSVNKSIYLKLYLRGMSLWANKVKSQLSTSTVKLKNISEATKSVWFVNDSNIPNKKLTLNL